MKLRQGMVKKTMIRLLKASKQQFYNLDGKEISVEEYVDLCIAEGIDNALDYQKRIKEKAEQDKKEKEQELKALDKAKEEINKDESVDKR